MRTSLERLPDLETPGWLVLVIGGVLLAMLALVLHHYEGKNHGRGQNPEDDTRGCRACSSDQEPTAHSRGQGGDETHCDCLVDGGDRSVVGAERSWQPSRALALTHLHAPKRGVR